MKTHALYLEDSYLKTMRATVLEVIEEAGRWRLILDKTIFYPLGGGQPTDQGFLRGEGWEGEVNQVLLKDGEINHYCKASTAPPLGLQVTGEIDWTRRFLNMRRHSAAHVIDFALAQMGLVPNPLHPLKGDHSKKSFIIYGGLGVADRREEIEKNSNALVLRNLKFSTRFVDLEELNKVALYVQPGLPANKPLRVLTLDTIGNVADGGTQVNTTGEVGSIIVSKIEEKDGNTIVTYSVG